MADFNPSEPFFLDKDGVETHIGDTVEYEVMNNTHGPCLKSGIVARITYADDCVLVKLARRTQNIDASVLTRIDDTSLEGKLKAFVVKCKGLAKQDAIEEMAAWIRENVNVDPDEEVEPDPEPDNG